MTSLDDYVLGGYFLIKVRKLTEFVEESRQFGTQDRYFSEELLPERIVTLADDLTEKLPDTWALDWRSVDQEIGSTFHIDTARFTEIIKWVTTHMETEILRYPNVWLSPDDAQKFVKQFSIKTADLVLVGIGLHCDLLDEFLAERPPPKYPNEETPTLYEMVRQSQSLKSGGEVLGWELLGYEYNAFCSWLCQGAERAVFRELGISPNAKGFIGTLDEANQAAEFLNQGESPHPPLHPWLIVQYPLA